MMPPCMRLFVPHRATTRHVCATSDYLLKHSHGLCLPVYQSCASTIVGSMVKRVYDKAVEGNDGKTLHVVDKKAHNAEQASKTSAQPPKQRFQNFYVSRQLVQLHRGGCVFTAMWPYCVPTVKLR